MDPLQDLGIIANLIDDAFAHELDERSLAAIREMRWMARLSPFVWWWAQADPAFRDSFNGFVWEEPLAAGRGRQVIGNVSLNRAPGNRQRRIICNVVVQEEYRGRGIGRQLTEAAIAEAWELGAEGVVLQVYEDNPPALQLYTGLGFQEVAGETDLRLEAVRPVDIVDAPGYRLRAWRPADGRAAHEVARLVTLPVQHWLRPVQAARYRPDWWSRLGQRLTNWMAGRRVYRLTALKEGGLVATMAVTATFRQGEHHLELLVHPGHAGQVEAALVSRALHMLGAIPPKAVKATVDKTHTAALRVLHDYGFEEQRTLLTLSKDLT
jgi:ribosomal protein S18 acetylase RimI-like enzyme